MFVPSAVTYARFAGATYRQLRARVDFVAAVRGMIMTRSKWYTKLGLVKSEMKSANWSSISLCYGAEVLFNTAYIIPVIYTCKSRACYEVSTVYGVCYWNSFTARSHKG
jgi:hypothetical protein